MKKVLIFFVLAAVAAAMVACSCNRQYGDSIKGITQPVIDSASYALGVSMGLSLKQSEISPVNLGAFFKGFREALYDKDLKIRQDQMPKIIQTYVMKTNIAYGSIRAKEQEAFFAENAKGDSVQVTESGLQYKIIRPGNDSVKPALEDTVEIQYTGALLDGSEFDSTIGEGRKPVKFHLKGFIKGMQEGLQLVGEGGKIQLWVPYELGYGERSMGPAIPKFSTLVFDVELLKVYPNKKEDDEPLKVYPNKGLRR